MEGERKWRRVPIYRRESKREKVGDWKEDRKKTGTWK